MIAKSLTSKIFTTFALALTTFVPAIAFIQPAKADQFCQCVGYVQNKIGKHIPVWAAKDAISQLPRMGYRQVGLQNGAVVVFQTNHGSVNTTYGHIGIVVGSSNGFVRVRSANQWSNSQFRDAGCTNVSDVNFRINSAVSFWAR